MTGTERTKLYESMEIFFEAASGCPSQEGFIKPPSELLIGKVCKYNLFEKKRDDEIIISLNIITVPLCLIPSIFRTVYP